MFFDLKAYIRLGIGKTNNKKLQRDQLRVPSLISFKNGTKLLISVDHVLCESLIKKFNIKNMIIRIFINNNKYFTMIQDLLLHPYENEILSITFIIVNYNDKVTVNIPIKIIGEDLSSAVKSGGIIQKKVKTIKMICLVSQIPNYVVVDISSLIIGDFIVLSDLPVYNDISLVFLKGCLKKQPLLKIKKPRKIIDNTT